MSELRDERDDLRIRVRELEAELERLRAERAQRDEWQETSDAYVTRDAALAGNARLREALEDVNAALGDRLLARGPLSKEYAHSVMRKINEALNPKSPTPAPKKIEFTKEWCMSAAENEAGSDVGAGLLALALDPLSAPPVVGEAKRECMEACWSREDETVFHHSRCPNRPTPSQEATPSTGNVACKRCHGDGFSECRCDAGAE